MIPAGNLRFPGNSTEELPVFSVWTLKFFDFEIDTYMYICYIKITYLGKFLDRSVTQSPYEKTEKYGGGESDGESQKTLRERILRESIQRESSACILLCHQ